MLRHTHFKFSSSSITNTNATNRSPPKDVAPPLLTKWGAYLANLETKKRYLQDPDLIALATERRDNLFPGQTVEQVATRIFNMAVNHAEIDRLLGRTPPPVARLEKRIGRALPMGQMFVGKRKKKVRTRNAGHEISQRKPGPASVLSKAIRDKLKDVAVQQAAPGPNP